jgi:hypothetical protein
MQTVSCHEIDLRAKHILQELLQSNYIQQTYVRVRPIVKEEINVAPRRRISSRLRSEQVKGRDATSPEFGFERAQPFDGVLLSH